MATPGDVVRGRARSGAFGAALADTSQNLGRQILDVLFERRRAGEREGERTARREERETEREERRRRDEEELRRRYLADIGKATDRIFAPRDIAEATGAEFTPLEGEGLEGFASINVPPPVFDIETDPVAQRQRALFDLERQYNVGRFRPRSGGGGGGGGGGGAGSNRIWQPGVGYLELDEETGEYKPVYQADEAEGADPYGLEGEQPDEGPGLLERAGGYLGAARRGLGRFFRTGEEGDSRVRGAPIGPGAEMPGTSGKETITQDQADYLRDVVGWTDEQIRGRYNIAQ